MLSVKAAKALQGSIPESGSICRYLRELEGGKKGEMGGMKEEGKDRQREGGTDRRKEGGQKGRTKGQIDR